mmetsp:Transcript_88198/g.274119  ORF Transcript_88198/g.274119 Transcript_88198/m.274119 type:complete len:208 (-) Transcript_88198:1198-1821(-)
MKGMANCGCWTNMVCGFGVSLRQTKWAFTPPQPKAEPDMWKLSRKGRMDVSPMKTNGMPSTSMCGLRLLKWSTGGRTWSSNKITVFMSTVMPALPSPCPFAVLPATSMRAFSSRLPPLWNFSSEPSSMGSPRCEPLHWHSTAVISLALMRARLMVFLRSSPCAGPLGAVSWALRPSCIVSLAIQIGVWASGESVQPMTRPPQPSLTT